MSTGQVSENGMPNTPVASAQQDAIQHADYPGRIGIGVASSVRESRVSDVEHYPLQPLRADTVIDGWSTGRFTVRAASVRGDGHRAAGVPRQDEFALAHHPKTGAVIVAVADGVSDASQSQFGASAVCRYATNSILRALNDSKELNWPGIVQESAWSLVELARQLVHKDADPAVAHELYATTLTAALILPISPEMCRISAVSVGDTAVWAMQNENLTKLSGGKVDASEDDLFSPAVVALPQIPEHLQVIEHEADFDTVLLVLSDGIGDPLGDGSGLVGGLLRTQLKSPPELPQFARIADFSRQTFVDDRTLVAMWQHPSNKREDQ